jgi:DNA polymerase III subunit delta'
MTVAAEELGPVIGHEAAKRAWLDAAASGRLHHGWLLRGPRGVGKARLALQFAAMLLGARAPEPLSAGPDDPVARLIASGAHPDLKVIRRPTDDKGNLKSEIPVDTARELSGFFALRPAMGGWRVAVLDAVDELNRSGANAILKTLEEPPTRAVLILVSHGERAVLPTIRSRCRLLRVAPLSAEDSLNVLEKVGLPASEARRAAQLAPGRPGQALRLHGADAPAAVEAVARAAAGRSGAAELAAAMTQAGKSDLTMTAAIEALRRDVEHRAKGEGDAAQAGVWAAVAVELGQLLQEAVLLNQDRAQTIAAAVAIAQGRRAV